MTHSVKDIQNRHHVGEHTVLNWIRTGELKAINVSRRPGTRPKWRITEEALLAFEISRMSTAPVEQTRSRKPTTDVVEFY